ncbi:MAG: alkane 1-monooxygenase [Myxococcota bacterium]
MFLLGYAIPSTILPGLLWGGGWTFFSLVFVFGVTPIADLSAGRDSENRTPSSSWPYDLLVWGLAPVQIGLITWTLANVTSPGTSTFERVGLVLSLGVVTGASGITVAHELMHRSRRFEQALAEVLMTSVSYPHFCIEHVFGHHRHVATPADPATARLGESVYRFLPRTLLGGLRSFTRIEAERVRVHGRRGLSDARVRYGLLLGTAYGLVFACFGAGGVVAFLIQGAVAVVLLEVINYVEHYGLLRRKLSGPGEPPRYERVQARHSWNSNHRLTNAYLFHLPRHADHHFLASRPYHLLRHRADGPQLPAGYATMVILALVPPWWFRVMNPRVEALRSDGGVPAERELSARP